METHYFILSFIILPILAFFTVLSVNEKRENFISKAALIAMGATLFSILAFTIFWAFSGAQAMNFKEFALYESEHYVFLIDFYFDIFAATYLFVGAFITFIIVRYSSYYMHLEKGYRRYFATILFFYFSYNFTVLAGNFETLFMGWEMLGLSSFLLIAFYGERYLPVRNAVKVFSIYRIGDIGILLAMWASHHLWHDNITFLKLSNYDLVHEHLEGHSEAGLFIAICLLIAAAAKSAQFPFSSWVPRAMEGPTPSSAIFYGSLSIHFGVFLLIRTMPFWEQQITARILIGVVGILTAAIGYFTARVQPTIKTQIAYASISQIGLMFLELALGLEMLALLHFVGNAFLRTYQLLVSPSVVSYLVREQFYHFKPEKENKHYWIGKKLHYSIYMLSLREFNLDFLMGKIVFTPFKRLGNKLNFITFKNLFYYFIPAYLLGWVLYWQEKELPQWLNDVFPLMFGGIALLMIMKAFSERKNPRLSWLLVGLGHFWIALAVMHNENFSWLELIWYLSGVVIAGILGYWALTWLKKKEKENFTLYRYYGHSYEYPNLAKGFLLCTLGLMGFPITTTFIGEDLIFGHIHENQFLLAFFLSSCFVIGGIALIRIYARLFLGPHIKTYHETPLQSS